MTMLTREEIFKEIIEPQIKPVQDGDEIAEEYLTLSNGYAGLFSKKQYCKVKGISFPTLNKYLYEYSCKKDREQKEIKRGKK